MLGQDNRENVNKADLSNDESANGVSGLDDAIKMECLKIANSFACSIDAVEQNYLRLLKLVNPNK